MHTMIRTYTGQGAKDLADLLVEHRAEVEDLLRSVDGLVSYDMARTADGCVTVTVCSNKAGTDESLRKAGEWLKANASHLGAGAKPAVSEGAVELHIS